MTGPPIHAGPSQAPPPALGHGPSNLFGGIMANQGGGGPGLAPPPPPPQDQQQQPPQHSLQQPAPGAQQQQGPPQAQPSSFGYQPGAAVNGISESTPHFYKKALFLTLNFPKSQDMDHHNHLRPRHPDLEKQGGIERNPDQQLLSRTTRSRTQILGHLHKLLDPRHRGPLSATMRGIIY